ncbi:GntR family transcriptional regulator [Marinicella sp. W31]|uniref:GntR family transcriptional regulator n=1 Tax=Marinicella sp. W31 TaxID=3023713 RepID=UPI0037583EEE
MDSNSLKNLFSLNPGSGVPIYRQLIDQVKQSIRMNLLDIGEQLPSVRVLAKELQINPMTISKAFSQLEIEGVLVRKRGVGMMVSTNQPESNLSTSIESDLKKFIQTAKDENFSDEEIMAIVQQFLSISSYD